MSPDNKSAAEAALSAILNMIPYESHLTVFLHLTKCVSWLLTKDTACPSQKGCRFGTNCWYKHCSSNDRTVRDRKVAQQSAHNPYTPAPTFFQRHSQKSTVHSHHHNQSEVPSSNESDSGTVLVPSGKHTGPDTPNGNRCSPEDRTGDESDYSNGESTEQSSGKWITMEKRSRCRPTTTPTQSKCLPNDLKKACRDCNTEFTVGESTELWLLDHGLHIPAQCQSCTDRRKQTAIENTKAAQPLTILQHSTTSRQVSNQTSYASVVTANTPNKFPFSPQRRSMERTTLTMTVKNIITATSVTGTSKTPI